MEYHVKRRWLFGISIFSLLIIYFFKNYSLTTRILGFVGGLFVFYLVDHLFDIKFKWHHYILISIILGSGILLSPFYFFSSSYDKILHFFSPILGSVLIFYIVDQKRLSIQWKLWITFLFITSFLMFHEIGEYLIDRLWDMKLQGVYIRDISGTEKLNLIQLRIDDTMMDLILGSLGALTFTLGKLFHHCNEKKCKLLKRTK